jgi:hypothetical protein
MRNGANQTLHLSVLRYRMSMRDSPRREAILKLV